MPSFAAASLARWGASAIEPLCTRGRGSGTRWRMLEYWWQVELFLQPPPGAAALGEFELPYRTGLAHRSQLGFKWADLAFVSDSDRALLLELKDLGRTAGKRLETNARAVGLDLAALAAMSGKDTVEWFARIAASIHADGEEQRDWAVRDEGRRSEYRDVHQRLRRVARPWCGAVLVLVRSGTDVGVVIDVVRASYENCRRRNAGLELPPVSMLDIGTSRLRGGCVLAFAIDASR